MVPLVYMHILVYQSRVCRVKEDLMMAYFNNVVFSVYQVS